MSAVVEVPLWAEDRETFAVTLAGLTLPGGMHIARLATEEEPGVAGASIIPIDVIRCDEIGPVVRDAVLDAEGNEIEPAVVVPGHHVNMKATGWLAAMLTDGLPADGTLFERTRILDLLGEMNWQPSAAGLPDGYVGTSGVKVIDPDVIDRRAREWGRA